MKTNFLKLGLVLLVFLGFHVLYYVQNDLPLSSNQLFLAYLVNYVAVVALLFLLSQIKTKVVSSLGFIFLAGSMLKVLLYFLFFQPTYKLDETVTKLEFFTFFTPYFVCLIGETLFFKKLSEES